MHPSPPDSRHSAPPGKGRVAAALLAGMLLAALSAMRPAAAQDVASRPVRVIVPFAAGGSADVLGRQLAQKLHKALGQTDADA